jgi:hypothetical protein
MSSRAAFARDLLFVAYGILKADPSQAARRDSEKPRLARFLAGKWLKRRSVIALCFSYCVGQLAKLLDVSSQKNVILNLLNNPLLVNQRDASEKQIPHKKSFGMTTCVLCDYREGFNLCADTQNALINSCIGGLFEPKYRGTPHPLWGLIFISGRI